VRGLEKQARDRSFRQVRTSADECGSGIVCLDRRFRNWSGRRPVDLESSAYVEDGVSKIVAFPAFWTAAVGKSAERSGIIEGKDLESRSATAYQPIVKCSASIVCKVKGTA
jgi:hypothetical protein